MRFYWWCCNTGLQFPVIVKPCAACGIQGSHKLCIVLCEKGFENLEVGCPACVQAYINHGGLQHKVYVVGEKVFTAAVFSSP